MERHLCLLTHLSLSSRLFHTLTMYFKFDAAAQIFTEIITIKVALEQRGEYLDYTILYTEFSKYSFLKNNYEEVTYEINLVFVTIECSRRINCKIINMF